MKISFLASHGGSSARAIIQAINNSELDAQTGVIITNNKDSAIYQWGLENDFPIFHISSHTHADSSAEDAAIYTLLKENGTDIVICSGYMKKVGQQTLSGFTDRILNIHPALLPRHGGKGMYGDKVHEAVIAAGETESGASVHVVNEHYDEGQILGQSHVTVSPEDSVESLRQKVQATEAQLYISCLKSFLTTF